MADTPADKNQDQWNEETVYGPSTVIAALDQIEDLVESSRAVPLSASIMVNKAEILDLLDQAREALPEDLVAADANAQAARIVSTENIVRMAEDRAREIVSEAKRSATSLREGADDYVASSLDELARLIADVSRRTDAGRRAIAERRGVDVTDVDLSHE